MISRLTIAAALAGTISSGALAADLGGSYTDDAPLSPLSVWSGKYIGVHLGGLFGDGERDLKGARRDIDLDDVETEDFIGGVHAGYMWSLGDKMLGFSFMGGTFVWGVEGDVGFAEEIDYLASLRTRSGIAFGNVLLYSTSGVAFIGFEGDNDDVGLDDDEQRKLGYVYGAGIEKKMSDTFSIGIEGLYYDFEDQKDRIANDVFVERELDFWTVRAKLSYWPGQGEAAPLK